MKGFVQEGERVVIVGLIADTHGRLPELALTALADCDHIIHAGDIGDAAILRELSALAPVTAVLGNNDYPEYGPSVQRFAHPVIDGVRFLVAHYPHEVRIGFHGCAGLAPGDPIPKVCVHGHTHIPELLCGRDARPADYLLCPGSVARPRGGFPPTVGHMAVESGQVLRVSIETLRGEVLYEAGRPVAAGGAAGSGKGAGA